MIFKEERLELECKGCLCKFTISKRSYNYAIKGYKNRQKDFCIKCLNFNKKKDKIVINCNFCNKSFKKDEYKIKKHENHFCSKKCNMNFLNYIINDKYRNEINLKISKTLKNKFQSEKKICPICGNNFETKKKYKTCSLICGRKLMGINQKGKERPKENYKNNGGLRDGGGRSKLIEYYSSIAGLMKINKEEIRLAKILDKLKINWKRNSIGFNYNTIDGIKRKFHPDFYLIDFDIYLEFKGWVTPEMIHKMENSLKNNNFKLLIVYGDNKRYKNMGLNIEMLEKMPSILFENI